jgi:hypothetical protein
MMSKKTAAAFVYIAGLVLVLSSAGCSTVFGPNLGMLAYPIPVSPYMQKSFEDRFHNWERYSKMPILGPITPNTPTTPLDTPCDDEVMRALEEARPLQGGLPMMHEIQRTNVRIVVEPIAADGVAFGYVDPPRFYPLVGPAQLHHAHYKCIVYFTEVTRVGWPIPYTTTDEDCQEVIYIDHDHLHMVGNINPGPGTGY